MLKILMILGLLAILLVVLILPFASKKVEHHLEFFLFIMGVFAVPLTRQWTIHLALEALYEPIPITIAVGIFGLVFKWTRKLLDRSVQWTIQKISIRLFTVFLIFILGLASSIITAIIAALILVEVISMLRLSRKEEINIVIIACFSIGIGAALTPVGEPLSTILIAKLREWPHVDFWYIFHLAGAEIIAAVFAVSVLSFFFHSPSREEGLESKTREENYAQILLRTGKIYLFVMALVFLGQGFKPLIDTYIIHLPGDLLYWINMISAVLDNATVTAAEISPAMSEIQIKKILMGLLISGGMLIPGNIPNIIATSKLKIKSKEWARLGVPLGFVLMLIFFFILKME